MVAARLGQDGQGAVEGLTEWAFHQLRSPPACSAFNHTDLAGAEKESLRTLSPAAVLRTNSRPCEAPSRPAREDLRRRQDHRCRCPCDPCCVPTPDALGSPASAWSVRRPRCAPASGWPASTRLWTRFSPAGRTW